MTTEQVKSTQAINGSCLCGAITFSVNQSLDTTDACHCQQCRKWSGHYFASADVKRASITISGEEKLRWYHSSEKVRRGFCAACGSNLFFEPLDKQKHDWIGVALGAFDDATQTKLNHHIFVSEKGDYYQLNDGVKQNRR